MRYIGQHPRVAQTGLSATGHEADRPDGTSPCKVVPTCGGTPVCSFEPPARSAKKRSVCPRVFPGFSPLHLLPGGKLGFTPATEEGFDEYVSDPAKPVPVLAGIGSGMPYDYLTYDQRFASRRTDVLAYQTEPLESDVTIAGPVTPSLRVSTSGTDSDFIVKLIDVYPNDYPNPDPNPAKVQMGGYQQLVRGEPFRGKFRNSPSKPEPFVPGKPAKIEFGMPDICHTFRTGHRIMVQIQSSWFPLVDLNPQQFVDIPTAKAQDFRKAVERIYRGGQNGSRLGVQVIQ